MCSACHLGRRATATGGDFAQSSLAVSAALATGNPWHPLLPLYHDRAHRLSAIYFIIVMAVRGRLYCRHIKSFPFTALHNPGSTAAHAAPLSRIMDVSIGRYIIDGQNKRITDALARNCPKGNVISRTAVCGGGHNVRTA